jgi:hypothetical protein
MMSGAKFTSSVTKGWFINSTSPEQALMMNSKAPLAATEPSSIAAMTDW